MGEGENFKKQEKKKKCLRGLCNYIRI